VAQNSGRDASNATDMNELRTDEQAIPEMVQIPGMDYDACRYRSEDGPPRCPKCQDGWLRPHVFLFGDGSRYVNDKDATGLIAWGDWREKVLRKLAHGHGQRLVILEIGCGLRVPNLRKRCEEFFSEAVDKAAPPTSQTNTPCVEFIRINPEFEDHAMVSSPTIPIKATALQALQEIDHAVQEMVLDGDQQVLPRRQEKTEGPTDGARF